jgi:tetratricopeptide (TPR) repeat protein
VAKPISARRVQTIPSNRRKGIFLFLILGSVVGGLYWVIHMIAAPPTALPTSPVMDVALAYSPASSVQTPLVEPSPEKSKANKEEEAAKKVLYDNCLKTDADGKGQPGEVAIACRKALQANPSAVDVMLLLSRAELDRGRLEDARSLARKAVTTKPDLAEGYIYLGGAEQELGRIDEARFAYRKYLQISPNGEYARELRAILDSL